MPPRIVGAGSRSSSSSSCGALSLGRPARLTPSAVAAGLASVPAVTAGESAMGGRRMSAGDLDLLMALGVVGGPACAPTGADAQVVRSGSAVTLAAQWDARQHDRDDSAALHLLQSEGIGRDDQERRAHIEHALHGHALSVDLLWEATDAAAAALNIWAQTPRRVRAPPVAVEVAPAAVASAAVVVGGDAGGWSCIDDGVESMCGSQSDADADLVVYVDRDRDRDRDATDGAEPAATEAAAAQAAAA